MALLIVALDVVRYVVLADVILSWVMRDPDQFPRSLTRQLTRPLYAPVHAVLNPEKTGGFDLAPIVIWLVAGLVQNSLR